MSKDIQINYDKNVSVERIISAKYLLSARNFFPVFNQFNSGISDIETDFSHQKLAILCLNSNFSLISRLVILRKTKF